MTTRIVVDNVLPLLRRTTAPANDTQLPLAVLSPRLARILVALDVLEQLRSERLIAWDDGYVQIRRSRSKRFFSVFEELGADVDPVAALERPCRVCAIGAVFVAHARRDGPRLNNLRHNLLCAMDGNWYQLGTAFRRIFPWRILDDMQDCYERWTVNCPMPNVSRPERLKLIMENIVRNEGHFKPEELRRKRS